MEPAPPPSAMALTTIAMTTTSVPAVTVGTVPPHVATSYPDSVDSSPRSRTTDGWDDLPAPNAGGCGGSSSLRLMCSYGGHIVPRPHDKSLCYIGGDTRIVVVDRNTSLSALTTRLSNTLLNCQPFTLKYQLPSEDLDSLISVTTDEDLDNMIDEYDRTISSSNSVKPSRLRLFLFPSKPDSTQSMGQILESSAKSDDWFLNALNSAGLLNRGFSDLTSVNNLLGLDEIIVNASNGGGNGENPDFDGGRDGDGSFKNAKQQQQQPPPPQTQQVGQDVHSVPDSPLLDNTSSFGSTSSSPSLANLPPIRVHVEDAGGVRTTQDQKLGIEDQFAQINVGAVQKQQQQQPDEGFVVISSLPPPMPATIAFPGVPVTSAVVSGEYQGRVYSDDERSDHGVPIGYRKRPTPQSQPQNLPPPQAQQKSSGGGHELPSPDSVSSDNSVNNPLSRQKPAIYQDPVFQIPSGTNIISNNPVDPKTNPSDPITRAQIQDSGYVLQPQFEQQQAQSQPPPQQQQPPFIHAAPHYVHHHPTGAVPVPPYIQVYPSQQQPLHHHHPQLDQQPYPVYYVTAPGPARQTQAYNVPVQQSGSVNEPPPRSIPSGRSQTPPNPAMMVPQPNTASAYNPIRNVPVGKPEMDYGGAYRTTTATGGPQLVQVPTSQHQHQHQHQAQQQFVGYSQIHHPAQSVTVSGSGGNASYGYEFADLAHAQIYYTQPPGHAQYQTMVLPDGSTAQLPSENVKQQIRSS